jgi:hypothetical protein
MQRRTPVFTPHAGRAHGKGMIDDRMPAEEIAGSARRLDEDRSPDMAASSTPTRIENRIAVAAIFDRAILRRRRSANNRLPPA